MPPQARIGVSLTCLIDPPIALLPQPATPQARPASVSGILVNIVLGLAELAGFGIWLLITISIGEAASNSARPGPEPALLAVVGAPGLLPFGLAVVLNGVGLWKASRGAHGASLACAGGAFVLGLIPWGVVIWFAQSVNIGKW